jgi:hypothetical protein
MTASKKENTHRVMNYLLQFAGLIGIAGILITLGGYKERFKAAEQTIVEIRQDLKVNAEDHKVIKIAIMEHTGKPIQ